VEIARVKIYMMRSVNDRRTESSRNDAVDGRCGSVYCTHGSRLMTDIDKTISVLGGGKKVRAKYITTVTAIIEADGFALGSYDTFYKVVGSKHLVCESDLSGYGGSHTSYYLITRRDAMKMCKALKCLMKFRKWLKGK
jgi:hypothetical protein